MTPIISRLHPFKFYGTLAFVVLLFIGMGTLFLFLSIDSFNKGGNIKDTKIFPVLACVFYAFGIVFVYYYWKNSPKIILDKQSIAIGNDTFNLNDIQDILLTGKMPFKCITTFPVEGTALQFTNGTQKFIYDDMYGNSAEIKLFLENYVVKKGNNIYISPARIDKNAIHFQHEEVFKGNPFTSARGISLWGIFAVFVYLGISKLPDVPSGFVIFSGIFCPFWFLLHSWLMHYFSLTKDYLIVRNHNSVWKVHIYRLADIREIVFETRAKQPNSMRRITKDFKSKLHPAATLRNKTWLKLKNKLEQKGITVRNESIYDATQHAG